MKAIIIVVLALSLTSCCSVCNIERQYRGELTKQYVWGHIPPKEYLDRINQWPGTAGK